MTDRWETIAVESDELTFQTLANCSARTSVHHTIISRCRTFTERACSGGSCTANLAPPTSIQIYPWIILPAQEAFSSVVIPPHSLSPYRLFSGNFFYLVSHKSFCFLSPCHSVSPEQRLLFTAESQHFGCICSLANAQLIILNKWRHTRKPRHSILDNLPVASWKKKKMKLRFRFPLYIIGLMITSCLHHSPFHECSSEKCLFSIIFVRCVSWDLGIKVKIQSKQSIFSLLQMRISPRSMQCG